MTPDPARGRVLVLQHLAAEGPGAIGDQLVAAGLTLTTVELDEGEAIPPLSEFDLMLVMGGPMDVWQEDLHPWMTDEKAAIREWVLEMRRPYVGVCLGHQLLADALHGEVGLMTTPEIGVTEIELTVEALTDPVFSDLPSRLRGLQWHGAQVVGLPPDGVVLAANANCAIQAFRVGPCAWGVQFHLEVGAATVPEWAQVPEYRIALETYGDGDADWLGAAVTRHLAAMQRDTETLLSGILTLVGQERCLRSEAIR
jgi:GMP synthase-like glutamine amidotransferase